MLKRSNRLGKIALTGSLALALSVPVAGAASAATVTAPTSAKVIYSYHVYSDSSLTQYIGQYGIDWNSLLQQYRKQLAGGYTNGSGTGTKSGSTGSGSAGSGSTNSGSTGSGSADSGSTNSGSTGSGSAGSGTANSGSAGSGSAGSGSTSSGSTGSGSAGSDTANSGSAGSGMNQTQANYAAQVVALVNQERAKAGLKALKTDTKLTTVAVAKAKDMYNNNYFDHNSPTYGSPFDMMKQFGVTYSYAGENIAKGQQNPQAVMTAWMNSSGHKANIMNANYTSIGVGYYNGEWVQEFTG